MQWTPEQRETVRQMRLSGMKLREIGLCYDDGHGPLTRERIRTVIMKAEMDHKRHITSLANVPGMIGIIYSLRHKQP